MKKLSLHQLLTSIILCGCILASPAWALSKDEAKAQGLIGEQNNGYLGIVIAKPDAKLQALVQGINNKRKSAYIKSAKKAGVEPKVLETRMGQRLQDKTPSGQYIKLTNGNWKKK